MENVSELLTRPLLRRDEPTWGSKVPWLAAVLGAGWALVAGFALAALPGVVVWIADGAETPLAEPLRFGSRLWLVSHHVGLSVGDALYSVAPLGLTVVFCLLLYRSARWAAHVAGTSTLRGAAAVVIPAVLTYAVGAGVVSGVSATPDVSALPVEAVAWSGLWAIAATSAGVLYEGGLGERLLVRMPPLVRVALAGGVASAAAVVVGGSLLVAVNAVANSGRTADLAEALDAGPLGTALLALLGAVLAPNAVVWGSAFALGPGFAVGVGTSVAPGGVSLGLVPAVPALGALPAELPGVFTWAVVALPVAAGVVGGLVVFRRVAGQDLSPAIVAATAGGSALTAMFTLAVLALVSGGSAGSTRLTEVGPVPGHVALASLLVVGVPAVAVATVLSWRRGGAATASGPDADEWDESERLD